MASELKGELARTVASGMSPQRGDAGTGSSLIGILSGGLATGIETVDGTGGG